MFDIDWIYNKISAGFAKWQQGKSVSKYVINFQK